MNSKMVRTKAIPVRNAGEKRCNEDGATEAFCRTIVDQLLASNRSVSPDALALLSAAADEHMFELIHSARDCAAFAGTTTVQRRHLLLAQRCIVRDD